MEEKQKYLLAYPERTSEQSMSLFHNIEVKIKADIFISYYSVAFYPSNHYEDFRNLATVLKITAKDLDKIRPKTQLNLKI